MSARSGSPATSANVAQVSRRLLDSYHATLVGGGVCGYSREQLQRDFQVGALRHAVAPATNWFRWGRSSPPEPEKWATRLQRFLAPYEGMSWEEAPAALRWTGSHGCRADGA